MECSKYIPSATSCEPRYLYERFCVTYVASKNIHLPLYNNYYMHELKSISTTILQHETQVLHLSSEDEIYMSCNWNSGDGKLDTANNYPQKNIFLFWSR